jgi:hypothetical protein
MVNDSGQSPGHVPSVRSVVVPLLCVALVRGQLVAWSVASGGM